MKINKYPDGTSYVQVMNMDSSKLTFKVNNYADLWLLNQFVDAWTSTYPLNQKPIITIPNLIDAQADRRFNEGESSGLKLVCKFLNGIDAHFRVFHPHNPEVVEAMMDNVEIINNKEYILRVLKSVKDDSLKYLDSLKLDYATTLKDNLILMSSDAGGFKPLMKLCDKLEWKGETYSASKARTKEGMVQQVDREDFNGKDILIIDDISVYGGTFKGLSNILRERNCGKLYLAVSHMTVNVLGKDPVTNYFDKVFTTNSKFDSYFSHDLANEENCQPENLEIIKLF